MIVNLFYFHYISLIIFNYNISLQLISFSYTFIFKVYYYYLEIIYLSQLLLYFLNFIVNKLFRFTIYFNITYKLYRFS